MPFFILFEAVEKLLWGSIFNNLNDEDLPNVIKDTKRTDFLISRRLANQRKDIDIGWSGLFIFEEILRFADYYRIFKIKNSERETLSNIRNRVSHADKLLIEDQKDVKRLTETRYICERILSEIKRKSQQLLLNLAKNLYLHKETK